MKTLENQIYIQLWKIFIGNKFLCPRPETDFYTPSLKGKPGAFSKQIVCLTFCLYVIPSHWHKVQYLKFGW